MVEENRNPQTAGHAGDGKPPRGTVKKKKLSFSPVKQTALISPKTKRGSRRSSSHFARRRPALDDSSDDGDVGDDSDDEGFTLAGAAEIDGASPIKVPTAKKSPTRKAAKQQRRRRRSSARFLRLSAGGAADAEGEEAAAAACSAEHLGEIYRQAIRMNAENKINAGNSWGLKLIENMDKFIVDDDGPSPSGQSPDATPTKRSAEDDLRAARRMKSKDERGRVNFAKASCTLDASVKIYSYRVDDVHLSSYRVLANLNRSDTNKGRAGGDHEDGGAEDGEEAGGGRKSMRRQRRAGPTETIESNLANINMSKLDSAYDIDPLFHKMSKSFDEGGAKGLLLGNLGVSTSGCHVVFDSKEATADTRGAAAGKPELEKIEEGAEENEAEDGCTAEDNMADAGPAWKESQIDITNLSAKLEQMLASYGHETSATVPFVPQLESLRQDYARLEEEGYGVDEYSSMAVGRKRLKLYDADEEDEREAEKSIHEMSMARSTGSLLGMTFDTNFRLSMDPTEAGPGGDIVGGDDFVGEGEFAPDFGGGDDVSFGGGDGEFAPDLGGGDDGGFSADGGGTDFGSGSSRHDSARVLLDALCSGDAFYEGGAESDYAFFDLKKLEKATDGNLWAGSQHWKKRPNAAKSAKKGDGGKKKVAFDNDDAGGDEKKKRKTKAKARVIIDFSEPPDVNAIFEKKKKKPARKTKKAPKDPYQMSRTEKDYLLPPDAGVDISQLTRLFSRPNAVVRRTVPDSKGDGPVGKTVGFVDVEENPLGFDVNDGDDADFGGGDDGGFTFGYDDEDPAAGPAQEDDNADYNLDDFDEVRKVEKIEVNYATVAKKVDVRRLKRDLWAELEEKTAWVVPEKLEDPIEDNAEDDIFDEEDKNKMEGEPQYVSFKNTVEKLDSAQSQSDVTVSFYFICCLHLANEKGLKLESTGLDDFTVSLDDGSAPTFGDFGDFSQTANKLRGKREAVKNVVNYVEDSEGE